MASPYGFSDAYRPTADSSPSPYASNRVSQVFDPNTPPAPPPKPSSHETSRRGTPAGGPPLPPPPFETYDGRGTPGESNSQHVLRAQPAGSVEIPDPGEQWLPKLLEDKSKQDLSEILSKPDLTRALAYSSSTAHSSTVASQEPLQAALSDNVALATHLLELEARLNTARSATQSQLLSTHALERQWKQKQAEMDRALLPFSPSSLYQKLAQGVQEQEMVCSALEESFLDGDGGMASEREVTEWVRRYREGKKVYYSRAERKLRWDEGRVGGWR